MLSLTTQCDHHVVSFKYDVRMHVENISVRFRHTSVISYHIDIDTVTEIVASTGKVHHTIAKTLSLAGHQREVARHTKSR
jgi:hypothetical protein